MLPPALCAKRILVQDGAPNPPPLAGEGTGGARRDRLCVKVTDGFERGAVIGPLIDIKAIEKVAALIADA